jgi:hypothetical protein
VQHVKYFSKKEKKVVTEYFGLLAIDRSKSEDGKSCDAKATIAAYTELTNSRSKSSFERYNRTLISVSFDGANVMLGKDSSVASRFLQECPNAIVVHALAHGLELSVTAAFLEVPYLELTEEVLQFVYNRYMNSPKQFDGLDAIREALENEPLLRFAKMHGIRWMASKRRAVATFLVAYVSVCIDLKVSALEAVKSKWTDLTVASDLLGQAVRVNGSRAKINKLVSPQGTALMQEKFELLFSNKDVAQFSRDEVILMLNEEKLDDLEKQVDWQHFVALTQWRLCATFHLVSDVSYELERFSLACQRDNNSISDIRRSVDRVYVGLERMKHENGGSLRSFYENYDDETETFMDLNMENVEDGKAAFESDRPLLLNSVITFVKAKFDVVLDHPVLRAAQAFEQKLWPMHDDEALDAFGNNDIRLLAKHFSGLDCMYNFNLDEAMIQWRSLKRETRRLPYFLEAVTTFNFGNISLLTTIPVT